MAHDHSEKCAKSVSAFCSCSCHGRQHGMGIPERALDPRAYPVLWVDRDGDKEKVTPQPTKTERVAARAEQVDVTAAAPLPGRRTGGQLPPAPWDQEHRPPQVGDLFPPADQPGLASHPAWNTRVADGISRALVLDEHGQPRVYGDGYTLSIKEVDPGINGVDVTLHVHARTGGLAVGEVTRTWQRERGGALIAHNDLMYLDPDHRGRGFAAQLTARLEDWYRESGLRRVEVHADIDVGGYTWAAFGFDFADEYGADRAVRRLDGAIEDAEETIRQIGDLLDNPKLAANPHYRDLSRFSPDELRGLRARLRHEADVSYGLLDAAEDGYGNGSFPSAYEISQAGRQPEPFDGPGYDQWPWLGKRAMLGSDWQGWKFLDDQ